MWWPVCGVVPVAVYSTGIVGWRIHNRHYCTIEGPLPTVVPGIIRNIIPGTEYLTAYLFPNACCSLVYGKRCRRVRGSGVGGAENNAGISTSSGLTFTDYTTLQYN